MAAHKAVLEAELHALLHHEQEGGEGGQVEDDEAEAEALEESAASDV